MQQERRLLHQLLHRGEVPAAPLRQPLAQRLEAVRAVPRAGIGGDQRLLEHVGELGDKVRRGDEFDEGGISKKLAMVCRDEIQGCRVKLGMRIACEANELRGVKDVENAHCFGEQHGGLVLRRRQRCKARSEW